MKIHIYNSQTSKYQLLYESNCLHPHLLIADTIMDCGLAGDVIGLNYCLPGMSDSAVVNYYVKVHCKEPESQEFARLITDACTTAKKVVKLKQKDKETMLFLGKYKSLVSKLKKEILAKNEYILSFYKLLELKPFVEKKVLIINHLNYFDEPNTEKLIIKEILNSIKNREAIISLDKSVDTIFKSSLIDSVDNEDCDFIKIPMWDIPPCYFLPYIQLNYTRENLKPALVPFKAKLKELSEELFDIKWKQENVPLIKQLCTEKLSNHIAPIQKAIGESLYLSPLKYNHTDFDNIKFCLGITSAETMVNYYEKNEIVEPYVASEIKHQLSRYIDLQSTYVFSYVEIEIPRRKMEDTKE